MIEKCMMRRKFNIFQELPLFIFKSESHIGIENVNNVLFILNIILLI